MKKQDGRNGSMPLEEYSRCGKEYEVQEMFEPLNADDEYTCRFCMQKLEDEGKVGEIEYYTDISEVSLSPDDDYENEGYDNG